MRTAERRRALGGALALYLAFIAYQSLFGGQPKACAAPLADPGSGWSGSDALANVVAYVPAGLLAGALAATFTGVAARAIVAFVPVAFSLSMELAQACLSGRVSSGVDWATNSTGAALGLVALPLAASLLQRFPLRGAPHERTDLGVSLVAWLVVGAWLAASTAPWRFTFDVGTLRGNLAFLRTAPSFDPWAVVRHAFAWMAVAAAVRALVAERRRASLVLLAVLAVSLGMQATLAFGRSLSWSELAGAGLGVVVALLLLVPAASVALARIAPALAFVSVAAYELAPERAWWRAGSAAFSWWPLVGSGHPLAALDFALYFCWFAFVLVLALRWRQKGTRAALLLGASAVLAMLAFEIAQLSIPGRTADTSPALIVALAFVVAWLLSERGARPTVPARSTVRRSVVRSARRS